MVIFGKEWKQLSFDEFDAFIGMLLFNGVAHDNKKSLNYMYGLYGNPFYRSVFSEHRFKQILRVIRFDKNAKNRFLLRIKQKETDSSLKTSISKKLTEIKKSKLGKSLYSHVSQFYSEREKESLILEVDDSSSASSTDDDSDKDDDNGNDTDSGDYTENGEVDKSEKCKNDGELCEVNDKEKEDSKDNIGNKKFNLDETENELKSSSTVALKEMVMLEDKTGFDKFRDIFNFFLKSIGNVYNNKQISGSICIDEQLVNYYGNCKFRQYMPSKPGKYGIKLWLMVDNVTGMIVNAKPFLGKYGESEKNGITKIVETWVSPYLGNYFTLYSIICLLHLNWH
ncbi:hypothetical protein EIN_222390 [Entamoeba invadens IP1]|uniref:PiggyBac transposable element-derived protein domain-containing protein n=1 Tax=Entamoeba invadens IP1 TaxID=370355 RepID=A0A0A1U210_ENTIV|nr:hypothetical protein EIN_222390 [Entamoeba invadens IP1]ELP88096.1 hypothetical protein EIN_222390 [Entamoeba invadens IP1]|eukprot:XP_004254867.1 hypothetical protein EIN_222390 [Entamoeba invadens IP1]